MILTSQEYKLVRGLKHRKALVHIPPGGFAKNGGVAFMCGDGDMDMPKHHREIVSARPHLKTDFGGAILLAPSFRGYDETHADLIMENIVAGMTSKKTSTFFCYFHYPCAMAKKYGHTVEDIFKMIPEVRDILLTRYGMRKIVFFFHIKRLNRAGKEEQNSYLVNVNLLEALLEQDIFQEVPA